MSQEAYALVILLSMGAVIVFWVLIARVAGKRTRAARRMVRRNLICPRSGSNVRCILSRDDAASKWLRVLACSECENPNRVECSQACIASLNWEEACARGEYDSNPFVTVLENSPSGDIPFFITPSTQKQQSDITDASALPRGVSNPGIPI